MTSQPTSQVTNSDSKATSTASSSKQVGNIKGNSQIQEEWVKSLVFLIWIYCFTKAVKSSFFKKYFFPLINIHSC